MHNGNNDIDKDALDGEHTFAKLQDCFKKYVTDKEWQGLTPIVKKAIDAGVYSFKSGCDFDTQLIINTVAIMSTEIDMKHAPVISVILYLPAKRNVITMDEVGAIFGDDVALIAKGLININSIETNHTVISSENYVRLLLSLAEDMRVIPIKIASRLYLIRNLNNFDRNAQQTIVLEVVSIYTSFAHKLGLYKIKTEMEDLCLKYNDRESYDYIENKISESKSLRDKYISEFIDPIESRLKETGIKYDMKGRVKSISSINNKLKKQKIDFESIYDLFAIRIIVDSSPEKEKAECWQAYSVVTDIYTPNPKRLKDWLSIPKSNGYESLHITVMGQESRWVEVQIRTKRMDEIAENGMAAHWKYKGVKNQSKVDDWLGNLREVLENKDLNTSDKMEAFKLDSYDDEIYVFTPKGDLHRLPHGATILDFAFAIHSRIGTMCISGKVNGRNVSIRHKLNNGDQIEIITSPNQSPKRDWLNFVSTTKAKNKIRQCLKEEANKQVDVAKELLKRRVKNHKMEISEAVMMRLIKKMGFKTITDFYIDIANGRLDVNNVLDQYTDLETRENEYHDRNEIISADQYVMQAPEVERVVSNNEELVLGENLSGVEYKMAKCCNPIYGDDVFGFVSSQGIKIHRLSCPNAQDMLSRQQRVLAVRWSGRSGSSYTITLHITGNDDIGVINNLTSIISKEQGVSMRSISIDSNDGLFQGNISVTLANTSALNGLMKKLKAVKGVKDVDRLN